MVINFWHNIPTVYHRIPQTAPVSVKNIEGSPSKIFQVQTVALEIHGAWKIVSFEEEGLFRHNDSMFCGVFLSFCELNILNLLNAAMWFNGNSWTADVIVKTENRTQLGGHMGPPMDFSHFPTPDQHLVCFSSSFST